MAKGGKQVTSAEERKERIGTRVRRLEDAFIALNEAAQLAERSIKLLHSQLEKEKARIKELENQVHAT